MKKTALIAVTALLCISSIHAQPKKGGWHEKMMKEKTLLLIMDGYQVALTALLLILITTSFLYHLFAGHLGFVGFMVAAILWYIMYRMFTMSVRDYKKMKKSNSSNEEA